MPRKKQDQVVDRSLMTQITLLRPKTETTDEDLGILFKAVSNAQKHIPCLIAVATGENHSTQHRGYTHAIILHFEDEERMREAMKESPYQSLLQKINNLCEHTITFELPETIPLPVVVSKPTQPANPRPPKKPIYSYTSRPSPEDNLAYRLQRHQIREVDPRLKKIVMDQLGVEEYQIVPNASLVLDLNADSLDLVEYIMSVEEEFKIHIPDEEAELLTTVGETQAYLIEKDVL